MPDKITSQRRRFPRKPCVVPVQMRTAGASYPMECETTDMSLSGCYVKNLFVLPVGTAVDLKITVSDGAVLAKGMVKTSDPGLGNGIEFKALSEEGRSQLQRHLDAVEQGDPAAISIIR